MDGMGFLINGFEFFFLKISKFSNDDDMNDK